MKRTFSFFAIVMMCIGRSYAATPDADYLAGLAALDAGQWDRAATAFSAASASSSEDLRYIQALGVAQLLGEHPAEALETMRRANRLAGGADRSARMWLSAAQCMSGDLEHARLTGGFDFREPFEKLVYDAFNTYGLSIFQARNGADAAQLAKWKSEGKALFPAVGREFSRRVKGSSGGAVREELVARAAALLKDHKAGEALTAIEDALPTSLDDPYVLWLYGEVLLQCSAPESARAAFTESLTLAPDASAAYLGRAHAHALLGDAVSAKRDLAHARERTTGDPRLRLDAGAGLRISAIEALLRNPPRDLTVTGRLAVRLRFDETYQEGLLAAAAASLDHPTDAEAWVALAGYLDRNMDVWSTAVEPRAPQRPFRTYRRPYELNRILQAADKALALVPGHSGALTVRASAMIELGDRGGAENLLRKALTRNPPARAYELLADLVTRRADAKSAEAAARRAPRVETSRETRADGEYIVTRTYPPTAADLARAAELEAEARALYAEATQHEDRFLSMARGTNDEKFHRARSAWAHGDRAGALKLLRELTQPAGSEARYHWQLLAWMSAGDATAYDEQFNESANRFHTTAAGSLRIAWRAIDKGAYDSATAALRRAAMLDPADARTPAYQGVVAEEQNQAERAIELYRTAFAVEEARLRMSGRGIDGGTRRLGPSDWPLSAGVGLRQSTLLARAGREQEALAVLDRLSRGLRDRVDLPDPMITSREAMALPEGQLPHAADNPGAIPEAPPANALLAWLHIAAADIHLRMGHTNEAGAAYVAALGLTKTEVRPYDSYNRDEKALVDAALQSVPVPAMPRFDVAMTVAQRGAIACGAIKSAQQIYQEDIKARQEKYKAVGDVDTEYARRSLEINEVFAKKRRGIDRFDRAGMQALMEDYNRQQKELQDWREREMRKVQGPGYQ